MKKLNYTDILQFINIEYLFKHYVIGLNLPNFKNALSDPKDLLEVARFVYTWSSLFLIVNMFYILLGKLLVPFFAIGFLSVVFGLAYVYFVRGDTNDLVADIILEKNKEYQEAIEHQEMINRVINRVLEDEDT